MIPEELRSRMRRLFFAEHWKVGTIAAELGVHHDTVALAIEAPRFVNIKYRALASVLDPYKSLIQLTLKDHPKLLATRLYDMITPRGYTGSVVQLRRYVRTIRPVGQGEAFFRLRTLPGEQAQVDWGCFGSLVVGKSKRPLSCFVMVLGWSRAVFAYFSLLVLDEVGYLAFDNRNADLLFQVVSRRYEKKSLVLTTNLAFSDWPTVFPSATCATALIDRVIHHADVIAIEGESYRLREAKEHAGRRHPAPRDDGAPKNKKK